jgi:hypothetical protein
LCRSTRSLCERPASAALASRAPRATWSAAPDVLELRRSASVRPALAILAALAERMPVPARAIRVEDGRACMAAFEAACAERGIARFTLPPRSPALDGRVERATRTHAEAFSALTDAQPTLAGPRPALHEWETTSNTVRPHPALGYRTPAEYRRSLGVEV